MTTDYKITELFYIIDEFCKHFEAENAGNLLEDNSGVKRRRRQASLSDSEIMTILLYFGTFRNLKHCYLFFIKGTIKSYFPKAVSYNRFVELESRVFFQLMFFLNIGAFGRCTGITFVDSTMIPVCHNLRRYAVLATIDKQELTFPLLNIKTPVLEAMNTVNKELSIPNPALIGQKAWREERTININDAIKALVVAINAERDKQNNGIQASVNKTYTYYIQQLNKLIIENKALQNENEALKAEYAKVKLHISQLDEIAVRRVTAQKDVVIERLNTQLISKNEDITKLKTDYNTL